jgi:hypothetical protein
MQSNVQSVGDGVYRVEGESGGLYAADEGGVWDLSVGW